MRIGNHLSSSIQRLFHITKTELVQSKVVFITMVGYRPDPSLYDIRQTSSSKILIVKCEADAERFKISSYQSPDAPVPNTSQWLNREQHFCGRWFTKKKNIIVIITHKVYFKTENMVDTYICCIQQFLIK